MPPSKAWVRSLHLSKGQTIQRMLWPHQKKRGILNMKKKKTPKKAGKKRKKLKKKVKKRKKKKLRIIDNEPYVARVKTLYYVNKWNIPTISKKFKEWGIKPNSIGSVHRALHARIVISPDRMQQIMKNVTKIETENEELIGLSINDKFDGKVLSEDLAGYELEITGTSDKSGFCGLARINGPDLHKVLLSYETGMHKRPKKIGLEKRGYEGEKTITNS